MLNRNKSKGIHPAVRLIPFVRTFVFVLLSYTWIIPTPRSNAEDISGNAENQKELNLPRTEAAETLKLETETPQMEVERPNESASTPSQVKIDAMLEEVEERNKVDVRGKQANGGTK